MTKDIHDYLQHKEKATQKKLTRAACAISATGLLLTGATACDKIAPSKKTAYFANLNEFSDVKCKPYHEIVADGIRAVDVLAYYDAFAEDLIKAHYRNSDIDTDTLDANFIAINPIYVTKLDEFFNTDITNPHYMEIYGKEDSYVLNHNWIEASGSPKYDDMFPKLNNAYRLSLTLKANESAPSQYQVINLAIPESTMDQLMEAFGSSSKILTSEDALSYNHPLELAKYIGKPCYNKLMIDRNLICECSESQLWALYNSMAIIKNLNLYGLDNTNIGYQTNDTTMEY